MEHKTKMSYIASLIATLRQDVMYVNLSGYITMQNNNPQDYINVDEVAFDILRRIYIVYCVELSDLAAILEEISNNRYKRIPPWNSSLGNSQDYPAKSQNGEGRGSSCTLSQHDPNIKNHSSAFDKRPNAEIRTLIIHHMASIMEDSHNRASWGGFMNIPWLIRTQITSQPSARNSEA